MTVGIKRSGLLALLAAIAGAMLATHAFAASATLKDQLVGTWTFVGTEVSAAGGKTLQVDTPSRGIMVFTGDGRFAQIQLVTGVARARSQSRVRGVEEDGNDATATESVASFGTYTVDDATRTVTTTVQSSTVPDWEGTKQKRAIHSVTAQELRLGSPAGGAWQAPAANLWKRAN